MREEVRLPKGSSINMLPKDTGQLVLGQNLSKNQSNGCRVMQEVGIDISNQISKDTTGDI